VYPIAPAVDISNYSAFQKFEISIPVSIAFRVDDTVDLPTNSWCMNIIPLMKLSNGFSWLCLETIPWTIRIHGPQQKVPILA
jgi:hypothetical protein